MGFFAVYCGLIYNEFFALPLNLFDSCFEVETTSKSYIDTLTAIDADYEKHLLGENNYQAPRMLWHPSQSLYGYG